MLLSPNSAVSQSDLEKHLTVCQYNIRVGRGSDHTNFDILVRLHKEEV